MEYKDFCLKLSEQSGAHIDDVVKFISTLSEELAGQLQEGSCVSLNSIGVFSVVKEMEHISISQDTKRRYLIPPALKVDFKVAEDLIAKMKGEMLDE